MEIILEELCVICLYDYMFHACAGNTSRRAKTLDKEQISFSLPDRKKD